jgi:hypothetical protein
MDIRKEESIELIAELLESIWSVQAQLYREPLLVCLYVAETRVCVK